MLFFVLITHRRIGMLYVLASLFCLCFTSASYCNVIWPTSIISTLLFQHQLIENSDFNIYITLLIFLIFMLPEIYLYYYLLRNISYTRALCYAGLANITTLLAIFVGAILINTNVAFILNPLVIYNITDLFGAYFVFLFIFTALIELITMKLITGYTLKKIIVPVLGGYALTVILLVITNLFFNIR